MKGTILQPTYLPWLGYFEMIAASDIFVVFDHVQFEKKSWQQRNRIKTANGVLMLSLPVQHKGIDARICDVEIVHEQKNNPERHWKTIDLSYKKAPFWGKYKDVIEPVFLTKHKLLRDFNVDLIKCFCSIIGIAPQIVYSSQLDLADSNLGKTKKVVNLCKKVGITHLYDAAGASEIIDGALFEKEQIGLSFQNYKHPEYRQLWGQFAPYMSIIDIILNEGERSLSIIRQGAQAI
jgi:hypothetical protein